MTSADKKPFDMIEIAGLWKSSTGKSLQGYLGSARIVVIPNTRKEEGSKQPDFRVFVAPNDKREKDAGSKEPF